MMQQIRKRYVRGQGRNSHIRGRKYGLRSILTSFAVRFCQRQLHSVEKLMQSIDIRRTYIGVWFGCYCSNPEEQKMLQITLAALNILIKFPIQEKANFTQKCEPTFYDTTNWETVCQRAGPELAYSRAKMRTTIYSHVVCSPILSETASFRREINAVY